MKRILLLIPAIVLALSSQAQNLTLSTNKDSGVYERGEPIIVKATTDTTDPIQVKVLKNNNTLILSANVMPVGDELPIFQYTFDSSCAIIVEARQGDSEARIGAIVDPGSLRPGFERPKDLDSYWNEQKQLLSDLPFEIKKKPMELSEEDAGYECFDIELNCIGPKPVRGYLAKPEAAAAKSLPIVIYFHAAGVKGHWCRSKYEDAVSKAKLGNGTLSIDINAHGMLNGQPESYYEDLEDGELHYYWDQGLESRDTYYFRFMYLRLLRTIEFATRQPEWDGKRILVIGESQGGGQSLAAAGLDHRVTAVVAMVPAMCDFGGEMVNRKGGWNQPLQYHMDQPGIQDVLPYFDNAQLLKGSKARIFVEIGLVDQTCPATSIFAAINQAEGKKTIITVPYRQHQEPKGSLHELWENTAWKPRQGYIEDYLK